MMDSIPKLAIANLSEGHTRDLAASGLTSETICEAGIYSAPERQVRDVLGYGAGPGMVFPYRALNGTLSTYARVKLDHADDDGKRYRSPAREPSRIYLPPAFDVKWLAHTGMALWITEGEKKALKASQEGLPCLALPGVWNWRMRNDRDKSVPIADLDAIAWRGRTVFIVFDSDLATNPSVKLAEFGLARELGRRGAKVLAVRLPAGAAGAKVGLDDYLVGHSVETLCQLEPVEIRNPALRERPQIVTARELLQRSYPEAPAIVGGGVIVRGSLNILGGAPKVGKSAMSLNVALCRSLARPWLGFRTTPGRTLVIQAEIPERELQTRLRVMLQDLEAALPDKTIYFVTHRGLRLDRSDGLRAARDLIEQAHPDLVEFDPLARFYSGDENSAREVGRLIGSLDDLIQTYGVAILLNHHTAKPSAQDPREGGLRLRGSSALFAAVDTAMILDRDEDAFKLGFQLRHGKEPEPMRLERTDHLWFRPAGPAEDVLAVAALIEHIGLKHNALVGAVKRDRDCADRTAERLVRKAVMAGVIAPDGEKIYRPTVTYRQRMNDGEGSTRE